MRLIRRPRSARGPALRGPLGSPILRAALLATLALAGCTEAGVIRVIDGREVEGRFISEVAYAYYARGADSEARGDLEAALAAYGAAAEDDKDSAEIWTRIGAVRCELKGQRGDPDEAFSRAEDHDADYEPLWRERARCAFAAGRFDVALAASARAVELDPEREDAAILHAAALTKLSRVDEARRELVALTIRHPAAAEGWAALAALGDAGPARRATDAGPGPGPGRRSPEAGMGRSAQVDPLAAIDAALTAGDLAGARRKARSARVLGADLAVRAAALGRLDLAREQAELVLGADPLDGGARIALAVAADLLGDTATLDQTMAGAPVALPAPPSLLARLLLAELLDRRVGLAAASAWLGPAPLTTGDDPLLRRVSDRVRARLAAGPAVTTGAASGP